MNKLLVTGLVASAITLINISSVRGQGMVIETQECIDAISSVENQLQSGRELTIELSDIRQLYYSDRPKDRPNAYGIGMKGNAIESVMNSPVLLTSFTTEIINNCNSISVVDFGVFQTDNVWRFGLMPNGKVEPFTCPEDYYDYYLEPYPRDLTWGEFCPP